MNNQNSNGNVPIGHLPIPENGTGVLTPTEQQVSDSSSSMFQLYKLPISTDLQSFGAEQSAKVSGNPHVLNTHFEWFFQDAMRNAMGKNSEQEKKIDNLKKEISGLESNNDKLLNDIKNLDLKILDYEDKIEDARKVEIVEIEAKKDIINKKNIEIDKIKSGDYSVLGTEVKPGDRIGYYLGFGIWIFLTIYLVIFYTSVIYSAFILDPNKAAIAMAEKGGIFSITIVNLDAIPDTYAAHGFLGVAFLLFATFMFIAMGYLIHKFSKSKKYVQAGLFYLFTFVFDAVLAFTIVKNIYIAQVSSGSIANEPWVWQLAYKSMDFYIILMAGFAVYLIWGVILDYMISEYDNIVPARVGIKTRETEIAQAEQQIIEIKDNFTNKISNFISKIEEIKVDKNDCRVKFDNNITAIEVKKTDIASLERTVHISIGDLKAKVSQFLIGWCGQIKMTNQEDSMSLIAECHNRLDLFYKTIKID